MFSKILDYLNNLNARQVLMLAGGAAIMMFAAIYLFLTNFVEKEVPVAIPVKVEQQRVTTVVVAKSDIAPRTVITENMVQFKEVPSDSVPNGAITSIADVVNCPAKITILAGDVITGRKLYKNTDQAGFVGAIPPDCRAVAINVNDVTGVAGFAKPGDYVDLMLVEKDDDSATANIILQNVLLLSINQSMDRNDFEVTGDGERNPSKAASNPTIATFALHPEEVLRLVSASKLGEIYLMLRPSKPIENHIDNINYKVISANAKPKVEQTPPVVSTPPPEPVPEKKIDKFVIIQGDDVVQDPNDEKITSSNNKSENK